MSLFSILKQPRIKSTAASLGVATLGGTQITLTMLEKLMDGMPIPLVKGVAGAGVEVIKIGRAMQENYSGCKDVIDRASSLLAIIIDIVKENDEGDIPEDVKKDIERLTSVFQQALDILKIVEGRSRKPYLQGALYHYDNTQKLKECTSKLDWAMQEFQVHSHLRSRINEARQRRPINQILDTVTNMDGAVPKTEMLRRQVSLPTRIQRQ
ncbi:hypothetical protein FRC02_004784 [Tulasnella sp. 418]|nr:hypothetical protein FRC02_004784 [Tulasnella sp. 418]